MSHYYDSNDLERFGEIGKHKKDLADKYFAWYGAVMEKGALTKREKSLIALAVAHALQCPYCIDAYSTSCIETGSSQDQITEAIHVAAAIRAGASLVHGIQSQNAIDKVMM